ncbi:MAG: CvpA family protein [Terriglobales bacterium]
MTGADWVIVAAIVLSVVAAAAQGFVYEVFSLAGVVVGYLAAAWQFHRVAAWYAPYVKTTWAANAAGFLTIFLVVVVLAGIIGRIARAGANAAGLRWFDRVLGGAFGLVRGFLVVTIVLVALAAWTPNAQWLSRSRLAPYMMIVGRAAVWLAPREVRLQFREGWRHIREGRELPPAPIPAPGK